VGAGCELRQKMYDQPKYEPLEKSDFFGDARSARPLVEGTVARGQLQLDEHYDQGKVDGAFAGELPLPVTPELLARGRTRYEIHCSPCHDRAGTGNGMVVQRGFRKPSSYHIDRLREAAPGYFYDVITRGFGVMPAYDYAIKVEDRWAIVAYIRALQRSQNAVLADVPEAERRGLEETP
jgi:mono/diheme cytochrome c family protein